MARQRSGSSSARNPRGPRGAKPTTTRPAVRSGTGRPASDPTDEATDETPLTGALAKSDEPDLVDSSDEPVGATAKADTDEAADDSDEAGDDLDGADLDEEDEADGADVVDETDEEPASAAARGELWASVRVTPVEIALPKGAGYTLRAYRMSDQLTPPDIADREDEFAAYRAATAHSDDDELDDIDLGVEFVEDESDEDASDEDALDEDDDADGADDVDAEHDDIDDEADSDVDSESDDADSDGDDDSDDEEEVEVKAEPEEVPVFLGRAGQLYLFSTPEGLIDFIRESDDHDLAQLDTWAELRERVTAEDIVPDGEDRYELDLVVENLRGGADTLDLPLLIQAGEAARDLGYALRLETVISALAPGSPLDDLDEAIRAVDNGGMRAFFARRKLRRIVTEQAALGWRTIIGKISGVVDWRN